MALEIFQIISVEEMTCPHCEANVTRNLTQLYGIDEVTADRNTAQVKITGATINLAEIEQVITDLGYQFKGSIE
jgi:hypothetical protein